VQDDCELHITARQYGEVVLPDAASGNCPGTPRQRGHETVPVQGGYGVLFAIPVKKVEHYECRGTKQIASDIPIHDTNEIAFHWRDPDMVTVRKPL